MQYIDRDALIERLTRMWESRQLTNTKYKCFIEMLIAEPTADVVERKEGKWIENTEYFPTTYTCPFCDHKIYGEPTNFCDECGADLREE